MASSHRHLAGSVCFALGLKRVYLGRAAVPHFRAAGLAPAESLSFTVNVPHSRTNAARHARIEACRAAEVVDFLSG